MAHIKIKKGLDIPIKGKPSGNVQLLEQEGRNVKPRTISLNFDPFDQTMPRLLKKSGEVVRIGEPLVEAKNIPGVMFVSPASGVILEVKRGLKRRLLDIVIEVSEKEENHQHTPLDIKKASREEILDRMKIGGLMPHIRQRPFDVIAKPDLTPRAIFVKAISSTPFAVPPEMQIEGYEESFQQGLEALAKLTDGDVHLVYRKGSLCKAFTEAEHVQKHTAEGPHPIGNPSIHIHYLSPIKKAEEVVWTINARSVACLGHLLTKGQYMIDRVISIAGPGVIPGRTGFFKVREGVSIKTLIANRVEKGKMRFVSGSILTGKKVDQDSNIGFYDEEFCVVPEQTAREIFHFFRLGIDKYSASKTYLSGCLDNSQREYDFTTSQHGEHRFFIIADPYDKVMPMRIPTMHLVKAVMAENFDLAELYGFLEVAPEDFSLATFVCPSKMEMVEIMKKGLKDYAKEVT